MNEGRLVFEGSEAELQASQDAYVRKFRGKRLNLWRSKAKLDGRNCG